MLTIEFALANRETGALMSPRSVQVTYSQDGQAFGGECELTPWYVLTDLVHNGRLTIPEEWTCGCVELVIAIRADGAVTWWTVIRPSELPASQEPT